MAHVLIVEDEPVLRSSMARGIGKLPGITVAEAGTIRAALEQIDAAPPRMIISDIDLPDRLGLELLGELGRRGLNIPLLFVSAYLKAYGPQIPPHANVDIREKPVQLDELRSIVQARLAREQAAGEDAPFGVADYIQLACLSHRSVWIDVESPEEHGAIVIQDGVAWTAEDRHGRGAEAFRRLAFLPGAVARVRAMREPPGEQTIHAGWEALLLDAAREMDESLREPDLDHIDIGFDDLDGERPSSSERALFREGPRSERTTLQTPIMPTRVEAATLEIPVLPRRAHAPPPAVTIEAPTDPFDSAWDEGITALLGKDYKVAFKAFQRAAGIRPDDPKVRANLDRLRELGHGAEE